jgi:hypothetical protein
MRATVVLAVGVVLSLCAISCGITNTGSTVPYELLDQSFVTSPAADPYAQAEIRSCLAAARDLADRARANRQLDMGMIAGAAAFSVAGLGLTTASTFVSDTHANGTSNDTRKWIAGGGAISVGIGAAILGLRTALNLGELSSFQTSSAAAQAGMAMKIANSDDRTERDALYGDCAQLMTKPNSAYPGAPPAPSSASSAPVPTAPAKKIPQ